MRPICWVGLLIVFAGCGLARAPWSSHSFEIGTTKEVNVGAVMIAWAEGEENPVYKRPVWWIQRELVYAGIDHDVLQISYKDYVVSAGDYFGVRPQRDYFQDLKYDISNGRTITYQDFEIRIDSADQRLIRFVVLKAPMPAGKQGSGAIGVSIGDGGEITRVLGDSRAEEAGLKSGDMIISVDGQDVSQMPNETIAGKIRGTPGTKVYIVVKRHGYQKGFDIVRP